MILFLSTGAHLSAPDACTIEKVCHLPHTFLIAPYVFIFAQFTSFVNHYFDKFFTKKCQIFINLTFSTLTLL